MVNVCLFCDSRCHGILKLRPAIATSKRLPTPDLHHRHSIHIAILFSGVDMYITNDRVILLDCQALWSPSLIEETSANPITVRSANIVTVDCLQIASFLMAICHVLIPVQDWFTDYNFIR